MTERCRDLETRRCGDAEKRRRHRFTLSPFHPFTLSFTSEKGFTLLEVLIAVAILGIAISVVLQLFSANMRALSASEDYVTATAKAEAKMREILDDDNLTARSLSDATPDGYSIDVSVTEALNERTENLQVALMDISLTVRWTRGPKERSLTLRTMKAVQKQV